MYFLIFICLLTFNACYYIQGDSVGEKVPFFAPPKMSYEDSMSLAIKSEYTKHIGVKELTGKNDGAIIEGWQRVCGIPKYSAWCNCFKIVVFKGVGVDTRHLNGLAASSYSESRKVFKSRLKSGDSVMFYYGGRITHSGFFDSHISENSYYSVEGNYKDAVTLVVRPYNTTHAFCRNW